VFAMGAGEVVTAAARLALKGVPTQSWSREHPAARQHDAVNHKRPTKKTKTQSKRHLTWPPERCVWTESEMSGVNVDAAVDFEDVA
jgi:hypothetical protein